MAHEFSEQRIAVPAHDCDIVLVFPGGKTLTVQCRPSNADTNYNGSLDILLPQCTTVTCWKGQDMQPAPQAGNGRAHERNADQLVIELPGFDIDDGVRGRVADTLGMEVTDSAFPNDNTIKDHLLAWHGRNTIDLRDDLKALEKHFEAAGGRGVGLAEQIDIYRIVIAVRNFYEGGD